MRTSTLMTLLMVPLKMKMMRSFLMALRTMMETMILTSLLILIKVLTPAKMSGIPNWMREKNWSMIVLFVWSFRSARQLQINGWQFFPVITPSMKNVYSSTSCSKTTSVAFAECSSIVIMIKTRMTTKYWILINSLMCLKKRRLIYCQAQSPNQESHLLKFKDFEYDWL